MAALRSRLCTIHVICASRSPFCCAPFLFSVFFVFAAPPPPPRPAQPPLPRPFLHCAKFKLFNCKEVNKWKLCVRQESSSNSSMHEWYTACRTCESVRKKKQKKLFTLHVVLVMNAVIVWQLDRQERTSCHRIQLHQHQHTSAYPHQMHKLIAKTFTYMTEFVHCSVTVENSEMYRNWLLGGARAYAKWAYSIFTRYPLRSVAFDANFISCTKLIHFFLLHFERIHFISFFANINLCEISLPIALTKKQTTKNCARPKKRE